MTSSPPDDRPPSTGQAGDALDDTPTSDRLEPLPPGPRRFRAGLVLSDRYRVLRFLAQGGMGEIYEAEDLQLAERVALKTVRAASAHDPTALDRFKREIQLARRVTHRNVCRIFEFGSHTGPGGDHIDFLTMELLPGETLLEKLQREGTLKPEDALPLLEQMVSALEAAHRAGVVHRDFKSANVLLVPTSAGPVRAVVTDFGLAQGIAGEGRRPFEGEGVSGTLDYMAPEQIEGQEPTPAVDVYALGVVVHEMLTGKRPFGGSPEDIQRRLRGPAPSPRALLPQLGPAWERLIVGCLERDPAKRFRDGTAVARALPGRSVDGRAAHVRLGVAAALLALVGYAGYRALSPPADAPPPAVPARRTFAVLPFKNLSGQAEVNWLATALSEMLTSELAAGQKMRAIAGEDVARMRVELQVPETDSLAKATLARIHANLGTDLVVSGSYLAAGGRELRVDVRVQEAQAGETISTVVETGTRDELLALVSQAGRQVREALGLGGLTAAQASELRAAQPANPEAARLYAAGLARLRAFDARAARDLLQKSVHAEPGFPLSHAALAEALSRLGYEETAREEARLAFEQGQNLPRKDRLLVEARYREIAREWSKAVDTYRVLFDLFPDALDHGLGLATALNAAGRTREADEVLAGLRRSATQPTADPRIDLVEAEVAQSLGDFRRQREVARRAAARGNETGARLLRARARVLEAYAAGRLGLESEAEAAASEARALYAAVGDRGGAAWALNRLGNVLYQQGELVKAERFYREAEAVFEEIGDRASLTALLNNTAEVFFVQGQLERAGDLLQRAATFARHSADPRRAVIVRLNMANVTSERGEHAPAIAHYAQALLDCRKLGDRSLEGSVFWHHAEALLHQGDLAAARATFTQAIEALERQGNTRYVAAALSGMGEVQREAADGAGSRGSHERALSLRQGLGDKFGIAESRLALAQLALDEGRAEPAEAPLREAAAVFSAERAGDREAEAMAVLARALGAQHRLPDALEAARRAETLARNSERPRIRLLVNVEAARQRSADAPAEASRQLQATLAEARRIGYRALALEADLTLADIDAEGASAERRRERLRAVEVAAREAGFERIARAAAEKLEKR